VPALPNNDQNAGENLGRAYVCEARRDGKRQFSAGAYSLDGVEVRLNTVVHKVVVTKEEGGSLRATGVALADGTTVSAKNVISSAGAFRSPQLLQLSGIGPAAQLKDLGIESVVDLADVGEGLTDHVTFFQHWRVRDPSAGYTLGSPNPLFAQPQYAQGVPLDWIACTGVPEDGLKAAIKRDEGVEADPSKHSLLKKTRTFVENIVLYAKVPFPGVPMDAEHVTTAMITFLPTSRGKVSLRSSKPEDPPKSESHRDLIFPHCFVH
jgi:choline dehydrogenase-like flavoprotein